MNREKIRWKHVFCVFALIAFLLFFQKSIISHLDSYHVQFWADDITHTDHPIFSGQLSNYNKTTVDQTILSYVADTYPINQAYHVYGLFIKDIFSLNGLEAHNILGIIIYILNGLSAYLFFYYFSRSYSISTLFAVLFSHSNFLLDKMLMPHTNLLQFFWIPPMFVLIHSIILSVSYKNALTKTVILFLLILLQAFSSVQYTVFLTILLPFYTLLLILFLHKKISYKIVGMTFAVFCVLAGISYSISLENISQFENRHPIRDINAFHPDWTWDYPKEMIDSGKPHFIHPLILFITIGASIFSLVHYIYCLVRFKTVDIHNLTFVFLSLALVCVVLMVGPGRYHLYNWFYHNWPIINHFRVPLRFFPFGYLFLLATPFSAFRTLRQKYPKLYYASIVIMTIVIAVSLYASKYFMSATLVS